jgi:hypothetical protein
MAANAKLAVSLLALLEREKSRIRWISFSRSTLQYLRITNFVNRSLSNIYQFREKVSLFLSLCLEGAKHSYGTAEVHWYRYDINYGADETGGGVS